MRRHPQVQPTATINSLAPAGAWSRTMGFALALSGLLALSMRLHAAGTIVYVDATASGTGDGSSWTDADPSLAGAASGTEIWVAKGTYKPTSGTAAPAAITEPHLSLNRPCCRVGRRRILLLCLAMAYTRT